MPFTKDEMNVLHTASDAKKTSAEMSPLKLAERVAAAVINNAANCGQFNTVYQHPMSDELKQLLESKGYTVEPVENSANSQFIIKWSDA